MNKTSIDIELIRKYLNGELSPAAMQELEAVALDDDFLQDALNGFENNGLIEADLNELQNRLAQRTKKKDKIFAIHWGLKQWGIAASLIIGISVLSIYLNQTPENKTIAVSELQKQEGLPQSVKVKMDSDKNIENTENLAYKSIALAKNENPKIAQQKAYSPADEISIEPLTNTLNLDTLNIKDVKVGSISSLPDENITTVLENKASNLNTRSAKINARKSDIINGKVENIISGDPIPGVQITNLSNGNSTVSDEKGNFTLSGKHQDKIEAQYVGFITEELTVNTKDSLKIDLKPAEKTPLETADINSGEQNQTNNSLAGPNGGWHTFRKYLDRQAHLSNQEKGRVVVQFMIGVNGKLTNFEILKSFSSEASDLALELIKNYNTWHGATNGSPQKAKVTVRFK